METLRIPFVDPDTPTWKLVTAGAVAALLLLVLGWRFVWVPERAERLYGAGYDAYLAEDFRTARERLEQVQELDPDNAGVHALLGWSQWRLGRPADALREFRESYEADPSRFEAVWGLGMALHAVGRDGEAIPLLEEAARSRPNDLEVRTTLAEAYQRAGRNLEAVALYRGLLERDSLDVRAESALLEIFGYPELGPDASLTLPERPRPDTLEVRYRARGDYLQARTDGRWRDAYLVGVNLGPGRPGEFAVTATRAFRPYREWLRQIAAMNANTVRVYTILPPAFYQALLAHNREADRPLWLIQEVWLADEAEDLFDPETKAAFEAELRRTVDLLHGSREVACRPGHHCGVYTADVSPWVIGLGVGREVEPSLVRRTNRKHPERTSWEGTYVSLDEGNPSEAWFAEMCDLAARYEMERHHAQTPLTVVSWPPLDPMHHPTEATYAEELEIRRQLGEEVPDTVPQDMNDMDVVSVDVARFRTEPGFEAGLFALYHVYQHWPDFLFLQPSYAEARDARGINRYLGYLLDLKASHEDIPLLIGEYGVATSLHPAHVHPEGWHNGGLSQEAQADLLVRFSRNIRDTDMAGGIVFAWLDEWWKQVHDEFAAPMEGPRPFDPRWMNRLDPEEHFGLVGYRPFERVPRLRGDEADWAGADTLYRRDGAGDARPGELETVLATSDYADVHLRLDLAVDGGFEWAGHELWIALNTLPGEAGSTMLPEVGLAHPSGANFLVRLEGASRGEILVSENYDPWDDWAIPGRPGSSRVLARQSLTPGLAPVGFREIVIEANLPRYGRDGTVFPPIDYSRSPLPYGSGDPAEPDYTSRALWHVDRARGMVELRLPWSLLLVMDPTRKRVFGGTDEERDPYPRSTSGISVAAFVFEAPEAGAAEASHTLVSSFPDARPGFPGVRPGAVEGEPAVYAWEGWEDVRYESYFKPAYGALRDLWAGWPRFLN